MHKKYSIKESFTLGDAMIVGFIIAMIFAFGLFFWALWTGKDPESQRKLWCAQTCGAHKVLVCETVKDPAWKKDRRAVACLLDPEGREVRFVIEQPEKAP